MFTRARKYQIFPFPCVTIATAMGLAIPRERRMVASCSWRPERDAGRLPGVPADSSLLIAALGDEPARTLLALAPTTPSYARLRVSRKRTLTPVIHHQLAKAFPPEAIAALRLRWDPVDRSSADVNSAK